MICIFEKTVTDFSSNGLGALLPTECTITETLNGTWELTMKHPLDAEGKWQRLQRGNIIRVPVPAAMTPAITVAATSTETREIWRVSTSGGRLHLRSGTGTKYKIIGKYKNGSQVILLKKTTSSWYEVTAPDGKRGYMSTSYLRFVRTETTPGVGHIVDANVVGSGSALRSAVICFYLSNEGLSVLENAAHVGLPVPSRLKDILAQLHNRTTENGGDNSDPTEPR